MDSVWDEMAAGAMGRGQTFFELFHPESEPLDPLSNARLPLAAERLCRPASLGLVGLIRPAIGDASASAQ